MKLKSALLIAATACIATTAFAGQRTLLPSEYEVGLLTAYGIWPVIKLKTGDFGTECNGESMLLHFPRGVISNNVIGVNSEAGINAYVNVANLYQNTMLAAKQSSKTVDVTYSYDATMGGCLITEFFIK